MNEEYYKLAKEFVEAYEEEPKERIILKGNKSIKLTERTTKALKDLNNYYEENK